LEPLDVLANRKRSGVSRLNRNSKIIKAILKAISDKKGEHVVSLDLRKINEAVADYFIICEAGSQPQVRAIADHIEEEVKAKCSDTPFHQEGRQGMQWVLLDYVDVVVHIMLPETRKFYKLEEMWSDAAAEEHNDL
jgi:ribosome-associated protein